MACGVSPGRSGAEGRRRLAFIAADSTAATLSPVAPADSMTGWPMASSRAFMRETRAAGKPGNRYHGAASRKQATLSVAALRSAILAKVAYFIFASKIYNIKYFIIEYFYDRAVRYLPGFPFELTIELVISCLLSERLPHD